MNCPHGSPRESLCVLLGVVAIVMAALPSGCAPPPPADFRSADPASRLKAIEAAARTRDRSAIPDLVESLDSVDPAIRLFAIETLRSLTGTDLGYRAGDSPERRAEAIGGWIEWVDRRGHLSEESPRDHLTEVRESGEREVARSVTEPPA